MLPLRDSILYHGPALGTKMILYTCIIVFFFQLSRGPAAFGEGISAWGFIPVSFWANPGGEFWRIFTSMFMHGSPGHIFGNLWFLWVFAPAVEGKLGAKRFLLLYFMAGAGAALLQASFMPASTLPMVGASGAISGVLGAYLIIFPRAFILTIVLPFIFFSFWIPAFFYLGYWAFLQLLYGLLGIPGVAWWAHLGGFLLGVFLTPFVRPRRSYRADPFWECWRGYC